MENIIFKNIKYMKVIDNNTNEEIVVIDLLNENEPIKIKKDFTISMKFTNNEIL